MKSIYLSYKKTKRINNQMRRSLFTLHKLESRLPGGIVYENLVYEWHRFMRGMNQRLFLVLLRQAVCYCFGSRITSIFFERDKDEKKRMISRFIPGCGQVLFHWTSQENLDSIKKNGIRPGKEMKYVYMTDDAKYIVRGGYFLFRVDKDKRDAEFVLLKIDALGLAKEFKIFCVDAPHEYAVREVPPQYITVYR